MKIFDCSTKKPIPTATNKQALSVISLEADSKTTYRQWFWFRVYPTRKRSTTIVVDISRSSFGGFRNYRPFFRSDTKDWERIEVDQKADGLFVNIDEPCEWFELAYFHPYSIDDHDAFLMRLRAENGVSVNKIGESIEGRDIEKVFIDAGVQNPLNVWITARQHPCESMGSFSVEEFVDAAVAAGKTGELRFNVHAIPMCNPDGVAKGHTRTNALGIDLNRSWAGENANGAPETKAIRASMASSKPDLFIDIHGVEDMRHCFLQPPETSSAFARPFEKAFDAFERHLMKQTPFLQNQHRFEHSGNIGIGSNWVTSYHSCLGMTLEMPFAEACGHGDWSADRSKQVGRAVFDAVANYVT